MRARLSLLVLSVLSAAIALHLSAFAQTQTSGDEQKPAKNKSLTLTGCVDKTDTAGEWTLVDKKTGETYKLTGRDMSAYADRQVQLSGTSKSKVAVGFGLVPTPNVAAQAGAMDPAQAAMAGSGATGAGRPTVQLPEFTVKTVKVMKPSCTEP